MELGSMSVLTLPGDNDTWSVTVFTASADRALHGLRDVDRFTRVVRACPLQAHWLDGEAITDMHVMAGILDRYRRFVVDDRPVATGVVAVGDAWACTNPSHGRGLSVGLLHAQRLRDAVRAGSDDLAGDPTDVPADDPEGLVRRFDASTEAEVAPFVRNQMVADRARIATMTAEREGTEPPRPDPWRTALGSAMLHDPDVFRAVMETITCLALPQEIFSRPDISEKIAAHSGAEPMTMPGPDRAQLLDLIS
jgi:flavin-dependent dehydrogenase